MERLSWGTGGLGMAPPARLAVQPSLKPQVAITSCSQLYARPPSGLLSLEASARTHAPGDRQGPFLHKIQLHCPPPGAKPTPQNICPPTTPCLVASELSHLPPNPFHPTRLPRTEHTKETPLVHSTITLQLGALQTHPRPHLCRLRCPSDMTLTR